MQPSGLLRAGSVAYRCGFAKDASGRNRWGDYTGVAIDPSETGNARSAAWADGNWAKGTNTWGSWIGKIAFNYHLIRGQVFHDCDSSAATSTDRLPLKDVKVLIERESVVFDSTTTDSTGSYKFGFLDDGTYDVIVSLPVDSWAVDALPGTGGDVQTKINETTLEVELSGASTASDTSSNNDFLIVVTHPVPVISSISPDMYSVGEPEFDLAVYGSDFVPCSIVGVDGADRVTTYVSPTEVHATVLASDISSLGTRSITVFNPLPGGGESNTATLTVHSPAPVFSLHPLLIDFGSSLQGVTKTDCVMVVNTGTADLLISGVTSDNSQFNATPSGATIHRQDSLKFDLTFNPSVIGATSGHIIFTHNADTTPDSADVTGTGLDSTTFRTATANDWASAVDAKGKHKAFPHKPDKVFFKLSLTSPSNASLCTILDLTFSMPIGSLVAHTFPAKSDTIPYSSLTFDTKRKVWRYTFSPPLAPNTTIQIDGIGLQGKLIKVSKYIWADAGFASTQKGKVPDVGSSFLKNVPGMPRPNLVNVMDELFPKGFGQVSTYFSDVNPLIFGSPQGTGGARSVKLLKSTNVVKSFIDEKTGTKHTHDPLCLTDVNVPKQLTLFSPLKINDNIAAELLALKLNIAASIAMKFPPGFGELEFYDAGSPSQPFNHKPVKDIAKYVDSLLSCLTIQGISPSPDLNSALQALLKINGEFQDAGNQKDTISFFAKSRLHGVKSVGVAAYLRKVPGAVPETFTASDNGNADVPLVYALHQNYPNPFNPTTMISFELPEPAIVTLRIFNVLGQAVSVPLDHQMLDDGAHDFEFEGKMLPSGVYFFQITAEGYTVGDDESVTIQRGASHQFSSMKKMLLIK